MANILISPAKYVQGAGEMAKLYDYAKNYGKKALVVITESGYKRIGEFDTTYHTGGCTAMFDTIVDGTEKLKEYRDFLKNEGGREALLPRLPT